ncbi:MAG: BspA family leucine-rich repeat surface protein [Bacilli bacterium]|nr:BspA family leucine-rich repeat surface protein [Bacilli bacterium]MBQ8473196.1 BspA family leucine-rich repeat surface protein [Bacilli bacterium]
MATTTDYLNQLKKDLTTAKTNLANLGVEVLESDTFTEVSAKMADIKASGSGEVEVQANGNSSNYAWMHAVTELPKIIVRNVSTKGLNHFFKFYSGEILNIDFTKMDQSASSIANMFESCASLKEIHGLEGLDTKDVTTMTNLFQNCRNLLSVDLSNFDTGNVTSMSNMFSECKMLTSLNLSNFNTSKVTNMTSMFYLCSSLSSLDISSFDMSKVTSVSGMFALPIKNTSLTDLKFGYNYGAGFSTTQSSNYSYYRLDVSKYEGLTETSIISILNGLYDIKSKGCNPQQCILGETNLAKLTSEGQQALAQAQAYGWTVS